MSFADQVRDLPRLARRRYRPDSRVIDRPGWYQLVTPSWSSDRFNEVEIIDIEGEVASVIDAGIDEYRRAGVDFKLAVFPGPRADAIAAYLESLGLATWMARAMWCPTDLAVACSDGAGAVEVGEPDRERFIEVSAAAWQDDLALLDDHRDLFADPDVHLYLASRRDQPLGTAAAIDVGPLVYLSGAAIRPDQRGRGGYRALVAARLAGARQRGLERAGTHAREMTSAPILEKLGFETLFRYRMFSSRAP